MTVEVDYDKQLRRVDENQSFGRTAVLREQYWISLTGWVSSKTSLFVATKNDKTTKQKILRVVFVMVQSNISENVCRRDRQKMQKKSLIRIRGFETR
jgi:hypothetical protein